MKRFLARRVEYLVAAGGLTVIAVTMTWWAVLAHRLVTEWSKLHEKLIFMQTGEAVDLSAEADRLKLMVTAEFSAMAVALFAALAALLYIAREKTLAQDRMARLLQFTSHELKTPIAGVRALLQSLKLGSVPEARRGDFIHRGLQEMDRLEHLAETVLAWQRAVAAREQVDAKPCPARGLVEGVLEHRAKTGVEEQVTVRGLPEAWVLAEPDAFRVILENLLDNARKYGGGKAEVEAEQAGDSYRLSVRDFGPGFPPEHAQRLFDPFRRSEHEGVTHGSGLGLYLAHQLALRMRGQLTAHSDGPGRGATFTISLTTTEPAHA